MILCLSTSSPLTSVAFLRQGEILFSESGETGRESSRLIHEFVGRSGISLSDIDLFVADVGPGSFTGIKVGVMMAKAWGFVFEKPVAGISSFDLIAPQKPAYVKVSRREFFVRQTDMIVTRTEQDGLQGVGYGLEGAAQHFPDAARVIATVEQLKPVSPIDLMPDYGSEPAISIPKS